MNEHPALTLLELFEGPLSAVSFPDTDGETLGAASLRAWATELDAAEARVREAERALEACRSERAECDAAFRARAQRAHAYARVYAEERPEWLAALDAIPLAKPSALSRAKKDRHASKGGTISLLADTPVRADVRGLASSELAVDDAEPSPHLQTEPDARALDAPAADTSAIDASATDAIGLDADVGTVHAPRRGRPRKELGEITPPFATSERASL